MALTLAQIRTQAQQIADMENSGFVSDSEWLRIINQGYRQVYNLLVNVNEDYFTTTTEFTITSGNTEPLPSDFYKLRGVDYKLGENRWIRVQIFNHADRNLRTLPSSSDVNWRYYRIYGGNIHIQPNLQANGTYRLWYVPTLTELAADGDTVVDLLMFEDYIAYWAARQALVKEESSTVAVNQMLQKLETDIRNNAVNRDSGMAETIADADRIYYEQDYYY